MLFVALALLTLLIAVLIVIYLEDRRQQLRRSPTATIGQIWGQRNRRRAVRIPVVWQARYTLRDAPDRADSSRIWNVSDSGVAIVATEKLPPGAWLQLQVTVNETDPPLDLTGRVAWTRPLVRHDSKGRRMFESGIALAEMNPADQKRLEHYLDRLRQQTT